MAVPKRVGSGWHKETVRHRNARLHGRAGGKYKFVAVSKSGKRTPIYVSTLKEAKAMSNLIFAGKGGTLEKYEYEKTLDSKQLNEIGSEWRNTANKIHQEKFGKPYQDFGSVIGAGITIIKDGKAVAHFRGTGQTGEQEATEKIRAKLEAKGYRVQYDAGWLD